MTVQTIQPEQPPGDDVAVFTGRVDVGVLTEWVEALAITSRGVEQIIDTPFVPASFWPLPRGLQLKDYPNPAKRHPQENDEEYLRRRQVAIASTTTAINVGAELGLRPNAALKYLYVMRGRPQLYAEGMLALLHSRGHRHRTIERGDKRAAIAIQLRGRQEWAEYEFTYEQAERAKYPEQNAKYKTDPWAMLWARVVSIAIRSEVPEVLGGLAGEADVVDVIEGEVIEPSTSARVSIEDVRGHTPHPLDEARAAVADAVREQAAAPASSAPATIDEASWRKVNEAFVALGVTGPGQQYRRLLVLGDIVGRSITKPRAELTQAEGEQILTALGGTDRAWLAGRIRELEVVAGAPAQPAADVDMGDADPDGDDDLEPTEDELAAAAQPQAGQEPAGWEQ